MNTTAHLASATRLRHAAALSLATAVLASCAARPSLPPSAPPPRREPAEAAGPPASPPVEERSFGGDEAVARREGPDDGAAPSSFTVAPSPLASIGAGTAPNVAAATRLAEKGRHEILAGAPDAALEPLERAISIDPNNTFAYYFLAEAQLARGRYDQALAFAERATILSARLSRDWRSRCLALQGRILEAAGSFAAARVSYARAIDADGRNVAARAGLGRLGTEDR